MSNIESPMKGGLDELRAKAENPFFRAPHSPFYLSEPFDPGASRADLLCSLRADWHNWTCCVRQGSHIASWRDLVAEEGMAQRILQNYSEILFITPAGRKELWSCIKALDNRYSELKLGGKIERLVDRAAKLRNEPAAFAIERQAIAGNRAAHGCFTALQRCHDGRSKISSENWEPYRAILRPPPTETCAAKAEQLIADWWRDDLSPEKPWDDLALWLSAIGNPTLAAKLVGPNSPDFFYATLSEHGNRRRSKALVQCNIDMRYAICHRQ